MTSNSVTKSKTIPLSTLVLCGIALICLVMIGVTGYVKYQLDRSEGTLAAPDTAFTPDQELYQKTTHALGYSGFLAAAQNFMNTRDRAALGDMRMNFKTAQEAINRLGSKAPTSVRRDMTSIMDIFASLITKAEESDTTAYGLTSTDLLTAATSLSTLEMRMHSALASNRLSSYESVKSWGMWLMLIAWSSLIAIGGLTACLFFVIRNRQSEPMKALIQSLDNMVSGNMTAQIWGTERNDPVGEIARAIDRTRQRFLQIPDISVLSEDGPVHMKFEGESRSLFENMMKNISLSFEQARQNALGFTGTMNAQHDILASIISRFNGVLGQIQQQGTNYEETIQALSTSLTQAAESLAYTQTENNAQVGRLVPYMQERIQNMAEVTHLAGNQVTQSLQTLLKAETTLRGSATQSQQVVQQLANATNQMGERMFAALNLMQASGKKLNDTTETVKSRFNEAVDTLGRGENNLQQIITRAETRLASTINAEENMAALASRTESSAEKMEKAVNNICERHEGLSEQVITATHRMESIVASFDAAQRSMSEATTQVRRDGNLINSLLVELRANNDQLLSSVHQNSQTSFSAVQSLAEKSHALMQRLEIQIQQQAQSAEARIDELTAHGQVMAQQATSTTSTLAQTVSSLKNEQDKLSATRARFSDTITDIGTRFEQQATTTFGKTEQWAAQSFAKLSTIAEQVESVMQRLGMLGQLTGTLGTVAGQLGQLVPTLTQLQTNATPSYYSDAPTPVVDMSETKALIVKQTEDVLNELQHQWHTAVVQMEAMHDQLAQIVVEQKDQLETRLVVMDKKLRDATENMKAAATEPENEERQADIMNEIISAISKINEHVIELDGVIEDAGLKKEA